MANNDEGRRFRFGSIGDKPVILVMTGLSVVRTVS
jgi:hypothetical protein